MPYFFDTLPVHPQPQTLEAFTSFVPGLAVANGIKAVTGMSTLCFPSGSFKLRKAADYPVLSFEELPNLSACSIETLRATTFYYLVEVFGRSTHPQTTSRFLTGMLGATLRYCPLCLRERLSYILPWRFTMLSGCPTHCCRLRDSCPGCGQVIPLVASPLQPGYCPTCSIDLTVGNIEQLNSSENDIVQRRYADLEFLLQPCKDLPATERARLIGNQFALQRSKQGLSMKETSEHLSISSNTLRGLEWGNSERGSLNLTTYIAYADHLQVSLGSLIRSAFQNPDLQFSFVRDSLGRRSATYIDGTLTSAMAPIGPRKRRWSDEELVAMIEQRARELALQQQTVTGDYLLSSLGLNRGLLKAYPRAKSLLKDLISYAHQKQRADYLERVRTAIDELKASGKALSIRQIRRASGVSDETIHRWPELRELVSVAIDRPLNVVQSQDRDPSSRHNTIASKREQREDEILAQLKEAISFLNAQNQEVTQAAICQLIGRSVGGVLKYSRARALLMQVAEEARNSERSQQQHNEREIDLERQVAECIRMLSQDGTIPTQKAIAACVGIAVSALRKHPSVRRIFDTLVQLRQQKQHALKT